MHRIWYTIDLAPYTVEEIPMPNCQPPVEDLPIVEINRVLDSLISTKVPSVLRSCRDEIVRRRLEKARDDLTTHAQQQQIAELRAELHASLSREQNLATEVETLRRPCGSALANAAQELRAAGVEGWDTVAQGILVLRTERDVARNDLAPALVLAGHARRLRTERDLARRDLDVIKTVCARLK